LDRRLPHRYRRQRLPALERPRPHSTLIIKPRRPLSWCATFAPQPPHRLRPSTTPVLPFRAHASLGRQYLEPIAESPSSRKDAYVWWSKVGTAQAGTPVCAVSKGLDLGGQVEPLNGANFGLTAATAHAARHHYLMSSQEGTSLCSTSRISDIIADCKCRYFPTV
jgi:hypothetical protein